MAAAFSHVIFDLDGTLLNTLEDLAAAGNHTCEMHGWPTFAVDEYRYKVGNGMLKLVERFMPAEYAGDGRMFEQTLAEFRAYYGEPRKTTVIFKYTCNDDGEWSADDSVNSEMMDAMLS